MTSKPETKGYIYVATTNNPELSDCVKIGYSKHISYRINSLRRIEKYSYLVKCCLEVPCELVRNKYPDKYVHAIIDTLDPDLKACKNEYYYMDPKKAAHLLENIGKIFHTKLIYPMMYINKHGTISFETDENRIKEMILTYEKAPRSSALIRYLKSLYGSDLIRAWSNKVDAYGICFTYGDIYAGNSLIAISNFPHSPEYSSLIENVMPNFWITTRNYDVIFP